MKKRSRGLTKPALRHNQLDDVAMDNYEDLSARPVPAFHNNINPENFSLVKVGYVMGIVPML